MFPDTPVPAFCPSLPLPLSRPCPHLLRRSPPSSAPPARSARRPVACDASAPRTSRTTAADASRIFTDWMVDNGTYLSDKATWGRPRHPLAIADETTDDGEASGRGLIAVKGLTQGEPVFEVPEALLMTKARAVEIVPGLADDVDDFIGIACLLVFERAKGAASFWKPYFDILPADDELAVALFQWTDDELETLLTGSPTVAAAKSLREKLRLEFVAMEDDLFSGNRAAFPEHMFTIQMWQWAFTVIFSRAIFLQKVNTVALVPYADLLNHSPFVSTYIDMQSEFLTGDKYVALYTDRPYSKMDQVFVTYGPKSNAELLVSYGFLVDRNPYDAVELSAFPSPDDPLYDQKVQYLAECGYDGPQAFPLYADRYPMELIEFLRYCVCDEDMVRGGDFGNFVSEQNEAAAATALIQACDDAIAAYPTTTEDDKALMSDRPLYKLLGVKERCAIRQRLGEKVILQRTRVNIEAERAQPSFMFAGPSSGGG